MGTTFYFIKDLNLIGKQENYIPYIYERGKGWEVDNSNVLMDRIMGYSEVELTGSPYAIGNTDIMESVSEITEAEANKLIKAM